MDPIDQHQAPPSGESADHPAPAPRRVRMQFTGTGAEYFRIWIVNLLLTIVTLGIYSAWAKVRKLQYLYRNTRLDQSGFDYHGNAIAILKGRILAVILAIAYKLSLTMLGTYALVAIAGLIAVVPWLLTQSYRFRLHNSSYRGLRFRFSGPAYQAYLMLGLPMVLVLAPGALALAGAVGDPQHPDRKFLIVLGLAYLTLMLLWPYLHYSFKRWQHGNASYGTAKARFEAGAWDFYAPYLTAALILVGAVVLGSLFAALIGVAASGVGPRGFAGGVLVGILLFYGVMIAVGPLVSAWIQNAVWSGTRLEAVDFSSDVRAARLIGITVTNLLMIVFSLGLLIPFAVIRSMKYRIESIEALNADALEHIGRDAGGGAVGATGEGAIDVMDLDFGL